MAKKIKINIQKTAMRVVGVAAGAVGAKALDKVIPAGVNPKLRGMGKLILGAVLPMLAPKLDILGNIGDGMIAQGAVDLATEMIPGINSVDDAGYERADGNDDVGALEDRGFLIDDELDNLNGYQDDVVNGYQDDVVNGYQDDVVNGYGDEMTMAGNSIVLE
jgi:hypothetical protein